jgi:CBS domain-containing protein
MSSLTVPVGQYMTAPVHAVRPETDLAEVHEQLTSHGVSSLAVTDGDGQLQGVVSRTDLLRVGRRQSGIRGKAALLTLPKRPVSKVMTTDVVQVAAGDPLSLAARHMVEKRLHRVLVGADGKVDGIVSTRDVMLAIRDKRMGHPISRFMSSPLFTVRTYEPISLATERLEKARVSGLVVVEDEWPVGVFTQREALESRDLPRDTPVEETMSASILVLAQDTRLHRAAAQAAESNVRRVVAVHGPQMHGILTGIDFARAGV